jgi:hypothetical protein
MRTHRLSSLIPVFQAALLCACIAFACASPSTSEREERRIFDDDPFGGLFGGPALGEDDVWDEDSAQDPSAKPKPSTKTSEPPKDRRWASFFELPDGWIIDRHAPETQMYKLGHPDLPDASLVLSTQQIEPSDGADSQEALRNLHNKLVTKLPQAFRRVELREWLDDADAHILTRHRGQRAEGQPEIIITGHSLARHKRAYLILGAGQVAQQADLQRAIDAIILSLHPPASPPSASSNL